MEAYERLRKSCRKLAKENPGLEGDALDKKLIKLIVAEKIQDDDAWDFGREYYQEALEGNDDNIDIN